MSFEQKILLRITAVVVLLGAYFIFDYSRNTTYQDVMSKVFQVDEEFIRDVNYIRIESQLGVLNQTAIVEIEDREMIRKLMQEPLDMNLKKEVFRRIHSNNLLVARTDAGTQITVYFDRAGIEIKGYNFWGNDYRAENNILYDLIREAELEWEFR